jgi:uncharacterized protein YjbI with pentapeptide repeats
MKVIKPLKLGLLTRCYEYQRCFHLGVSIFGLIPLADQGALQSEVSLWKFAAEQLGKDAVLDAGIPKSKPEFLVTGSAYTPGRRPMSGCQVRARLGKREKLLHVIGDRYLNGLLSTDPEPFDAMPLDWTRAFGGEGFDKNPLGKGFKPVRRGAAWVKALPNIIYPTSVDLTDDQLVEPAGFGPLDLSWPQRMSKAGTHDDRWLKEDFPGFARDIDWTFFNLASPDQWLDQPLRGDEPYLLENMHPEKPVLTGNLPGVWARCYISRHVEGGEKFEEVEMSLSTVWFFPHAERAVLIFQGRALVQEEDAADVVHILAGWERIGEAKGVEHYRQVLARRLDKEKGHLAALQDEELLPAGMNEPDPAIEAERAMIASEELLEKNLRRKAEMERQRGRALVASFGLDPDQFGPPALPAEQKVSDIGRLPDWIDQVEKDAQKHQAMLEAQNAERDKFLEQLCAQAGMDFKAFRAKQKETPTGPPRYSAAKHLQSMRELFEKCRLEGVPLNGIDEMLNDPKRRKMMETAEAKLKEMYRLGAHRQKAAPAMPPDQAKRLRADILEAYLKGESFAGRDLTGADLSGMDLQGADFECAFLESVDFSGANLQGCRFKNAVLAHAVLTTADLTKAVLEQANIGGARLAGATCRWANVENAILAGADLTGADFQYANLQGVDSHGAVFRDADFSGGHTQRMNFLECDLRGVKLAGANMEKCVFLHADVTGVDFSLSSLQSATFLGVRGRKAKFRGANLSGACFVEQCDFEGADFAEANLFRTNLRGTALKGCDFTRARLDEADLSLCDLRQASFQRATALEARFVKADLAGAVMGSLKAINAVFQRADLRGANLRGANLFQSDLARVYADSQTVFDQALMKKVRIYPLRGK